MLVDHGPVVHLSRMAIAPTRALVGDEAEELLDDSAGSTLVSLRDLLRGDPRLERVFATPPPAAFERGPDGDWVLLEGGLTACGTAGPHDHDGRVNLFEFEGKRPTVHPEAFVAPTATLIGDVTVEKGASIWFGAVLRADICTIVVREGTNIQDNSVLHAAPGETLVIGPGATVGHSCVVHCAEVGEKSLVGNGSTLLDGARIGAGTLVAAGSVVTPGTEIPPGVVAAGIPCKPVKAIGGTSSEFWVETNPGYYQELARRHADGAPPVG